MKVYCVVILKKILEIKFTLLSIVQFFLLKLEIDFKNRRRVTHLSNVIATIEGHCDERGSRNYNLALGLRRAGAVKQFLIAQGIDQRRLTVVTYGKDRPEVKGHNKNAWKLNHRVVTVIIIKAQSSISYS